jgi:hypothetical protein
VASCSLKVVRPVRDDCLVSSLAVLISNVNRADESDSGRLTRIKPRMEVSSSPLKSTAPPFPRTRASICEHWVTQTPQQYARDRLISLTISTQLSPPLNGTPSLALNPLSNPANSPKPHSDPSNNLTTYKLAYQPDRMILRIFSQAQGDLNKSLVSELVEMVRSTLRKTRR